MNAYLITVAGISYVGLFPSQQAAAANADWLYPQHWPAQVKRLEASRAV